MALGEGPRKDLQEKGGLGKKEQGKQATWGRTQPAWAAENTRNFTHARNRYRPSASRMPGAMPGPGDTVTAKPEMAPAFVELLSGSPAEGWGEIDPQKITLTNMSSQTQYLGRVL